MSTPPNLEIEDVDLHGCRVCQKIMHGFRKRNSLFNSKLGTVAQVMNMPCPHAEWIRAWWESGKPDSADKPELWTLYAWSGDGTRTSSFEFHLEDRTFFRRTCELVLRADEPGHPGIARILNPQWIHPSVAGSWYSRCLNEHGDHCNKPSWMKLQPGRTEYPKWLVDVCRLCVVPFGPATMTYLTLSYTWGQVEGLRTTTKNIESLKRSGSLHPNQSPGIPQTVYDAMKVTQFLGEKYLWVDSLCIIQDDQAAFYRDLNAMHLIYANSVLCLVALAGTDGNHGLRGIEGVSAAPRSVEQVILDMAGGEKLSHFKSPCPLRDRGKPDVSRSPGTTYIERGWTYQEFAFAPRRLVFTDGPLRWACQCVKWGEELLHEIVVDQLIQMPDTDWMKRRCPSLHYLVGHVASDFNERHFRFQGDALRAFLGIQNYLDGLYLGGLNYGLPELFFDVALAWRPKAAKTREMKRRIPHVDFLHGEDCLPSWSWMSWQGDFEFLRDGEFDVFSSPVGCLEPVSDWLAALSPTPSPDQMRPIRCRWHEFKRLAKSNEYQVPQRWRELSKDCNSLRYQLVQEDSIVEEDDNPFFQSRYPIPIPATTRVIEAPGNLPFLFSKTTRAFLHPKQARFNKYHAAYIDLYSRDGEPAGNIQPHQSADVERFLSYEKVELVAVAKGWTTELHDLAELGKERQIANVDVSSGMRHKPRRPSTTPLKLLAEDEETRWKATRGLPRRPCYFVLCVMWQNGWATRQASGTILADIWDRIHEPVDLVLG